MKVEIIFMDAAAPKVMEVDNEYVKGNMLCLRYGNMITKYPLDHIFSISHEHGPHIGSKEHYDKYINKNNNKNKRNKNKNRRNKKRRNIYNGLY